MLKQLKQLKVSQLFTPVTPDIVCPFEFIISSYFEILPDIVCLVDVSLPVFINDMLFSLWWLANRPGNDVTSKLTVVNLQVCNKFKKTPLKDLV